MDPLQIPAPGTRPPRPPLRPALRRGWRLGAAAGLAIAAVVYVVEGVPTKPSVPVAIGTAALALAFWAVVGAAFGAVVGAVNWGIDLAFWKREPPAPAYRDQLARARRFRATKEPLVRPVLYAVFTVAVIVYAAQTGNVGDLARGDLGDQPLPAVAAYVLGAGLALRTVQEWIDAVVVRIQHETRERVAALEQLVSGPDRPDGSQQPSPSHAGAGPRETR